MKGLPPALRKALKTASKLPCKAVYSPSGERLDTKAHKYGAKATTCLYGHPHDSRKEAMWCVKLRELEKEGKIYNLIREPMIVLSVNGRIICNHYPDFCYTLQLTDQKVFCDVKGDWEGGKRPEWVIKKKLCEALYPDFEYHVV